MKRRSLLYVLLTIAAFPVRAEDAATRNPADAYGGGQSAPQPLTPEAARAVYRIPVDIAPGPFTADWKSFTADKLKPEPDWWRALHLRAGRASRQFRPLELDLPTVELR